MIVKEDIVAGCIQIEDSVGVCGVRDDTRALAEAAAQLPGPGRALDMGTGSGYVGIYLALHGWEVDATDVSPRAVELARRNAAANGAAVRVYQSDLFDRVEGTFDLILFNPPMRPDETEFSRIVTSLLRRSPRISGWLMRVVGDRFERGRHEFLASVLTAARGRLNPGGRVLMGVSSDEIERLGRLPGVRVAEVTPIPTMPRQDIVHFALEEGA